MSEDNINDFDFKVDDKSATRSDEANFQIYESFDSDLGKSKKNCSLKYTLTIAMEVILLFVGLTLIFIKAKRLIMNPKDIRNENQGNLAGKTKFSVENQNITNQVENKTETINQEAEKNEGNKNDENQEKNVENVKKDENEQNKEGDNIKKDDEDGNNEKDKLEINDKKDVEEKKKEDNEEKKD